MANGDAYSRLVQIAKIVLPLIALGILSTLFLFSRSIDPQGAIPFADIDVEEAAREQRLTNARYATVDTDGAAIELHAREARPDPDDANRIDAVTIVGHIEFPDGARVDLSSGAALIDLDAQTAGLTENVLVSSTLGYRIEADKVLTRMDFAQLTSDGPVVVETPFGTLEAGNMLLTKPDTSGAGYRLLFTNKVKLIYDPVQ